MNAPFGTTRETQRRSDTAGPRPVPEDAPRLIGPDEAAHLYAVKRRFLLDLVRRGELAAVIYSRGRDGRVTRCAFDPRDLDRFVAARRQEAQR